MVRQVGFTKVTIKRKEERRPTLVLAAMSYIINQITEKFNSSFEAFLIFMFVNIIHTLIILFLYSTFIGK